MSQKRGIQSRDLYKLKSVNQPQFSPDGSQYLFVQTEIDEKSQEYMSHLYVSDLDGEKVRQYTHGKVRDQQVRWSPDGSLIAFLSNRTGKSQLYILDPAGGEPRQLTKTTNGVNQYMWSPDSKHIFINTTLGKEEDVDQDHVETKENKVEPMVVEKLFYKSDASGFFNHKYNQIVLVEVKTGEMTVLTDGNYDYSLGSPSPDGRMMALLTNPSDEADYELNSDVYLLDIESRSLKQITSNGSFHHVSWSPCGQYLTFIGHEKEYRSATLSRIWLYELDTEQIQCLTYSWDVQVGDVAIGDFQLGNLTQGLVWTEDSKGFYFLASDQGSTNVYYGDIEGLVYPVTLDDHHVYSFTVDVKTHKLIAGISTPTQPGELFFIDLQTGLKKQLTNVNQAFLNEIELSPAESISFNAEDGLEIHGWLMKPVGFKEGQKVPLIVEIHGGPHMMYANSYFHEFQTLAAKGYAVLFTNPRGSHGYGQDFVDKVRGDYGGKDYLDIMSAVDYVLENYDFIDESRLGVTGGSYGGFMTNWIVGHTNRFKAAVTQRSITNWISFYGVSDIGYFFTDWEVLRGESFDPEKLWNHSPLKYVNNIETPLLILHGEKDYRCPIEQAEQLYVTLKHNKKETMFVRFPEANHELSRSGHPNLRIHRLDHIANWFDKYL
ncbi:S9 family peptidase [Bacillus suaedaesalsae]|uniref:S9 family peptidase n=1 Tax=Bacillus suaedaesalsae TaxID=2810349 RepID=A0ABS2DFC9_9BACI|nr:S9 family peptidase [Bacillus suaedaesalsae]MBM6617159.1 S9 family peptidase [Bacillus suaedaesalsae]